MKPAKPSPAKTDKPSRFAGVLGAIGKYTGVSAIAGAAIESHDALIERAITIAREHGVPEHAIQKALKLKAQHDKAADALAALFPGIVISPTALRALAGKSTKDPNQPLAHPAPKPRQPPRVHTTPARPRPRR